MRIVFTRVSLILLVPLLVQAASPTSPHGDGSGNLDDSNRSSEGPPNNRRLPVENDHHKLRPLAPDPDPSIEQGLSLQAVDEYYKAATFPLGSMYGMPKLSADRLPIPGDGYYRVPPGVAIGLSRRKSKQHYCTRYPVVRLRTPNTQSCIATFPLHVAELPMLRIDAFIGGMKSSTKNDDYLQVWLLPSGSKYHHVEYPTNEHPIESDKYIQLPPKAVVTTPIGTFTSASGHVVRTAPHIDIKIFRGFKEQCQSGCYHATSQVHEKVSYLARCVEDCICRNVRNRSRTKSSRFSRPRIEDSGNKRKFPPPKK